MFTTQQVLTTLIQAILVVLGLNLLVQSNLMKGCNDTCKFLLSTATVVVVLMVSNCLVSEYEGSNYVLTNKNVVMKRPVILSQVELANHPITGFETEEELLPIQKPDIQVPPGELGPLKTPE